MNLIDNLIFAFSNLTNTTGKNRPIIGSDFVDLPLPSQPALGANFPAPVQLSTTEFAYDDNTRLDYVHFTDSWVIDRSIQKHWYDVTDRIIYHVVMPDATKVPPYHII